MINFDHDFFLTRFKAISDWYNSLWDHINTFTSIPGVHLVHYESLLGNPRDEIARLAKFIGKEMDEEELNEIVRLSSFNEMKKSEGDILHKGIEDKIFKKSIKFFRNGKSGEWRQVLTKEMSDKVEQVFKLNLKYQGDMYYDS